MLAWTTAGWIKDTDKLASIFFRFCIMYFFLAQGFSNAENPYAYFDGSTNYCGMHMLITGTLIDWLYTVLRPGREYSLM